MKSWALAAVLGVFMGGSSFVATALQPRTFLADIQPAVHLKELFPEAFGNWVVDPSVIPIEPSPDLQKQLEEHYSETLARTYVGRDGRRIMLSIAYGRNQHKGMNWHRPEICYPSQGIPVVVPTSRHNMSFNERELPVSRLVAANAARVEPITYWVVVGDRITSYGRAHKLVSLDYGIRGYIPDGMLIRVSSIDRDTDAAFLAHEAFIQDMLAHMTANARRITLGVRTPFVGDDLMPSTN